MKNRYFAVFVLGLIAATTVAVVVDGRASLSREELIADTRQLAHTLESVHPDPYLRGGGKVAFHRRLQHILSAIPADGLSRDEYYRLIQPFVAAVGDAHTWLDSPYMCMGPGGIPLYFRVVGEDFYIQEASKARISQVCCRCWKSITAKDYGFYSS